MKNTNKNTTVKDAAKYFWGKNELEKALKTDREDVQSEICMLSDSFVTNGSFMIYGQGKLDFEDEAERLAEKWSRDEKKRLQRAKVA